MCGGERRWYFPRYYVPSGGASTEKKNRRKSHARQPKGAGAGGPRSNPHGCSPHRPSTRAHSAGDRRGLGRRSSRFRHAPHRLALHMPRRLASFPRKLARHVCLTTPVHPSPWQELEVYFFAERFEQQAAGGVVDPPVSNLAACAACEPRSLPHHRPFTRVDLFVQVACCGVRAAAACARMSFLP